MQGAQNMHEGAQICGGITQSASPRCLTIAVLSILLIHAMLAGWIAVVNSPVNDEIAHLPAGLSHWKLGNFDLYRVNPPMMRMIAAIPLLWMDCETDWSVIDGPYDRPEFAVGARFTQLNGFRSFWLFTIARWAQIPVSMLGGWICYRWASELYGPSSGICSLVLWCFCPNILTWSATITPDIGASAFGVLAGYCFWHWLLRPTWRLTLLAGLALGLAELTKTTWIILFGLWPLLWLTWRVAKPSWAGVSSQFVKCLTILGLAVYMLNLAYVFEGSFLPLKEFSFISKTLGGSDASTTPGNRFREHWLGNLPVPVPANYVKGIDVQKYDFERRTTSYLRGEERYGGWYYYYLYGLLVKVSVGTLCLIGIAIIFAIAVRCDQSRTLSEIALLAPAIGVLILVSSQTGFNRHFRYVLPVIPFLYIFASRVFTVTPRASSFSALWGMMLMSGVVSSLSVFPHSMSYFNGMAGGPAHGPFHLLHSNIDWGQDLLVLKRYVERNPQLKPIYLAYYGNMDPRLAQFDFDPLGSHTELDQRDLGSGIFAVSVNRLYGYDGGEAGRHDFRELRLRRPDAMVGYSIYIYRVSQP